MKSFTNLYPQICSLENLYEAAAKARRRKTRREDVERFELHRERHIRRLHEELSQGLWQPSAYRRFEIHDPKTRTICAAPFRDRVVHHALCNVIGPLLERRFVHDSYPVFRSNAEPKTRRPAGAGRLAEAGRTLRRGLLWFRGRSGFRRAGTSRRNGRGPGLRVSAVRGRPAVLAGTSGRGGVRTGPASSFASSFALDTLNNVR
jgi:hypothetical protein